MCFLPANDDKRQRRHDSDKSLLRTVTLLSAVLDVSSQIASFTVLHDDDKSILSSSDVLQEGNTIHTACRATKCNA